MTKLFDDVGRRLWPAWMLLVRSVAAGVFGLAIALTVAVLVVGPETRDEWRALPARVASGEVRIPVVGGLLGDGGAVTAEAASDDDLEARAAAAASRSGALRTDGLARRLNPFAVRDSGAFVAAGDAAEPTAVPSETPEPEAAAPTVEPEPEPEPEPEVETEAAAPPSAEPEPEATTPSVAAPAETPTTAPSTSTSNGLSTEGAEVLRLVNVQRVENGCSELRLDSQLTSGAQLHSEDMYANDYMSHTSLDGRTPSDRAAATGYSSYGGENVAKGYRSAAAVMDGWMNSPGHRANILNCSFVAIGVGVEVDAWTQVFGYA
ncbi:CAP domain-containing protein [Sanguibacter antarcticus]|uniref:Uncharacterized protein YkwD n=1 Tax=Sanguibacter antarcticus TaxID=372484 RepID=A0A2A9E8P9_9MICO|nr:CAP domain-containing protein [Sanguibacter antarcticus]PFG35026.1 uncharacterized protein YkwD [Sanguibacter antarcticus]